MSQAESHASALDRGDRTRAFLWITVAYLVAVVVALLTGIACGDRHPIAVAFAADVAATLAIFAFSFAFGNSSFYDAYWSVAPPLIALWFVIAPGSNGVGMRQGLVVALVVLVAGAFHRFPVEPVAFAAGLSMLLVALLLDPQSPVNNK